MVSTQATMDGRQGRTATGWQHLYVRHKPEETPLYPIIEQHAHRFFAELREQGASLPSFVQAEFEHYLRCGRLRHGFLRVKCSRAADTSISSHFLVNAGVSARHAAPGAWSRPPRTWSTMCFPQVPIRQWVLSFPWPLRLLFAARPDVLTRVLDVVTRALSTAVIKRAGLSRSAGAQSGIVTFIQRFGSALNLNIHLHLLVLDGAYTFADDTGTISPCAGAVTGRARTPARHPRCGASPAPWCGPVCWSKIPSNPGLTWSVGGALEQLARGRGALSHYGGPACRAQDHDLAQRKRSGP